MSHAQWTTSSSAYGAFYKLPPRGKIKDPQHALLLALCPAGMPESAALASAAPEAVSDDARVVLHGARTVPQPGDGSCLFHSLAHASSADAQRSMPTCPHSTGNGPTGGPISSADFT